ncbi:uncharacterized protein PAC_12514 [Phialocephala subalpina]|uniref:Transcription factor domain-containing protein n=1 Tax=Phialocephala subalpina TaxID=576137 RepID=A0A1L7XCB7_9HELO|nr:uncharacterized protein PAC_12514 [Phialocephala subalpina]
MEAAGPSAGIASTTHHAPAAPKPDRIQASEDSSGFRSDINRQNLGQQQNATNSNPAYGGSAPLNGHANQVWRKDEGYGAAVSRNFFPVNGLSTQNIAQKDQTALPSIYTTTPYNTVFDSAHHMPEDSSGQPAPKRRRIEPSHTSSPQNSVQDGQASTSEPLPQRDMIQLIDIFRSRMLHFISVIDPQDLGNTLEVISQKRALALCICYVAARYVPGGDRTRSKLLPSIFAILQDRNFRPQSDDEKWTMLQALSVLYAYRTTVTSEPSTQGTVTDISHRTIKAFVESYALHVSVHRSIAGLRSSIRTNKPNITSTLDFKLYMYWLWLFNMSNHFSVVAGTPPSIRIDATIRAAPTLLENIDIGSGPRQILSEVELCILWDKISNAHSPGLAEWWCPPDLSDNTAGHLDSEALRTLDVAIDKALSSWSQKWGVAIHTEPLGIGMDFHFRFTQFCLSTYMIRSLSIGHSNVDSDQQFRLNNSVQAAHHFCELLLNAGPAERDGARYTGDFGFVMISFSCLFILEACKLYPTAVQDSDRILATVEEVALFLEELAVNSSHGPYLQGNIIQKKLHELDKHRQVDSGHSEAPVAPFSFEPGDMSKGHDHKNHLLLDASLIPSQYAPSPAPRNDVAITATKIPSGFKYWQAAISLRSPTSQQWSSFFQELGSSRGYILPSGWLYSLGLGTSTSQIYHLLARPLIGAAYDNSGPRHGGSQISARKQDL